MVQIAEKNPESVHFEEQIASSLNALDELPYDHDVVDGGEFKNKEEKVIKNCYAIIIRETHHQGNLDLILSEI